MFNLILWFLYLQIIKFHYDFEKKKNVQPAVLRVILVLVIVLAVLFCVCVFVCVCACVVFIVVVTHADVANKF